MKIYDILTSPVILRTPSLTILTQKDELSSFFYEASDNDGCVRLKNGAHEKLRVEEILDSKGRFYKVEELGVQRSWISWLSPIVDLVTVKCRIVEVGAMTVGELLERTQGWRDVDGRLFRKFLLSQQKDERFGPETFEAFIQSYR